MWNQWLGMGVIVSWDIARLVAFRLDSLVWTGREITRMYASEDLVVVAERVSIVTCRGGALGAFFGCSLGVSVERESVLLVLSSVMSERETCVCVGPVGTLGESLLVERVVDVPPPLGKKTPCRFLRHRSSPRRKVDMQGQKESGFNVSSAYVLKSDMESSFPVEAVFC